MNGCDVGMLTGSQDPSDIVYSEESLLRLVELGYASEDTYEDYSRFLDSMGLFYDALDDLMDGDVISEQDAMLIAYQCSDVDVVLRTMMDQFLYREGGV